MQIIFLGTGTSHGIPVVGCDCAVCNSSDPRNKRSRSSVLLRLTEPDATILIDTSIDFRCQMLRLQHTPNRVNRLDGILFTHHHADHLLGLDDVRALTDHQGRIDCYVPPFASERITTIFGYAFTSPDSHGTGGLPKLNMHVLPGPANICGHRVTPIPLPHGERVQVYGYRIGRLAYLTDCSAIPDAAFEHLQDLDLAVIDALRPKPHPTHLSIDQAIDAACSIGARRTLFTHLCHKVDHGELAASLPETISPAYDGLVVEVE